jgi:hypothetical protein
MATEFDSKKFGAFLAIPFTLTNATTGNSNTDLLVAGGAGTVFCAPASGSVVGVSAATAAITAGTITLTPHSAGTEFAVAGTPTAVLSSAFDTNGTQGTTYPGLVRFAAGDTLGISATTTTTLNPTNTLDVDAFLFVQLDPS